MNKSLAKHESFYRLKNSGKAQTTNLKIYQALLEKPRTIEYFRNVLNIPHQSCTGALSHLEDIGWVYKSSSIRIDKKLFTLYSAETDVIKAKERMYSVAKHKKNEWFKRGLKNAWFDEQTATSIKSILGLD